MAIQEHKLKFWAENEYNVVLIGKHGVGKTAIIEKLFNELYGEQGKDWLYYSAATMDPWVDFIGVPKEVTDSAGNTYLSLVRPEMFALDKVKAIVFDEFNRSPKKVRNAVMELMQFKSINGHKFNNLKLIWAAINPPAEDGEADSVYDVEKIDPAQFDRFHISVEVPYKVDKNYFAERYGKGTGHAACDWWNSLTDKQREEISPRRLDYAVDCWSKGGDVKDVFPKGIATSELQRLLMETDYIDIYYSILNDELTETEIVKAVNDERLFALVKRKLMKDVNGFKKIFPHLEEEKMLTLVSEYKKAATLTRMLNEVPHNSRMEDVLSTALDTHTKYLTVPKAEAIRAWLSSVKLKKIHDGSLASTPNGVLLLKCFEAQDKDGKYGVMSENTYYRDKRIVMILDTLNSNDIKFAIEEGEIEDRELFYFMRAFGSMLQRMSTHKKIQLRKSLDFVANNMAKNTLSIILDKVESSSEYGKLWKAFLAHDCNEETTNFFTL